MKLTPAQVRKALRTLQRKSDESYQVARESVDAAWKRHRLDQDKINADLQELQAKCPHKNTQGRLCCDCRGQV